MGLFDNLFEIEKDDNTKQSPSINSAPTQLNNPSVFQSGPAVLTPINPATSVSSADLDKFFAHFDDLFEKSNLPGPDYYEFSKMVQALNVPGMDDNMKMTAAFAGLKVQGLTKEKLVQTAQQYIAIIDNDSLNFNNAIDQKVKGDIENKKNNLKSLQDMIAKKQQLITQMQQEIIQETTEISTSAAEIAEQERKMNEKTNSYKIACDNRKNSINQDIQRITSIL